MSKTKTNIKVKLIGEDGNIFNLIGIVSKALRKAGEKDLAKTFENEVMSSDSYESALGVIMDYVIVK